MIIATEEIDELDWKTDLRNLMVSSQGMLPGNDRNTILGKIGYIYQCVAPGTLYKYYPDKQRNLDCVANNQMWYAAPIHFNDVFDCDIVINREELFDNVMLNVPDYQKIRRGSSVWKNMRAQVFPQITAFQKELENLRLSTGVVCLSESFESLLMWAHYANNHKGMCVEYDLESINKQLAFTPVPVIYSDERVRVSSFDFNSINTESFRLMVETLTSKSPEWSYEKEWRIIRDDGACGEAWNQEKHGAMLDMIQPSSIILGCAASGDFEQNVTDYCKSHGIDLFKMKKDSAQYRLNKEPVLQFNEY